MTRADRRATIWQAGRPFVYAFPAVLAVLVFAAVTSAWWLGIATALVYVIWGTARVTRALR
jgi:hypothetical protein